MKWTFGFWRSNTATNRYQPVNKVATRARREKNVFRAEICLKLSKDLKPQGKIKSSIKPNSGVCIFISDYELQERVKAINCVRLDHLLTCSW